MNDFSSPLVRVYFKAGSDLLPIGPLTAEQAQLAWSRYRYAGKHLAAVQDVTIEHQLGAYFTMSVSLTFGRLDAANVMRSECTLLQTGQTEIRVELGYVIGSEGESRVYEGTVFDIDFQVGTDFTFTLKGYPTAAKTVQDHKGQGQFVGTRWEVINQLAKSASPDVVIDGKTTTKVKVSRKGVRPGSDEQRKLDERVTYQQQGKTTWAALVEVVEQCLCHVKVDQRTNEIQILDRNALWTGAPSTRFAYFPAEPLSHDRSGGLYPVISVSSQSKQIFLPAMMEGTQMSAVSLTTAKPAQVEVPSDDTTPVRAPAATKGGKGGLGPKKAPPVPTGAKPAGQGVGYPGDPEDGTQKAKAELEMYRSRVASGVQVEVETLGAPLIEPGETVQLIGVGDRIDGNYTLQKVTHTIGTQGFTTKWNGISNAQFLADSRLERETRSVQQPQVTPTGGGVQKLASPLRGWRSRNEDGGNAGGGVL